MHMYMYAMYVHVYVHVQHVCVCLCACVAGAYAYMHMLCMIRVQHVRVCLAGAPLLPHTCYAYVSCAYVHMSRWLCTRIAHMLHIPDEAYAHAYAYVYVCVCTRRACAYVCVWQVLPSFHRTPLLEGSLPSLRRVWAATTPEVRVSSAAYPTPNSTATYPNPNRRVWAATTPEVRRLRSTATHPNPNPNPNLHHNPNPNP
jgi:hypothetical protein